MKVSLSWLKDYISIEMSVSDLAEALTMVGLEVESVSERYRYLNSVYVGRIVEIAPHPNADKLSICRVDRGSRMISVVCGAPNLKKDMLAPVALPGTELPEGTILEKSVIRGQISEGMLCSEGELGLGIDRSGVMVLDLSLAVGEKLADALELSDTILEFDLTPNRPDCLSLLGIAREIAAIQNTCLKYPDDKISDKGDKISERTSIKIKAPDHCPRYVARLLEDIKVGPSPFWLQDKLLSVGLRPINNIVDITNYVLMETGQPLHAFDFDRLAENRIVVRLANEGETFITLDQKERTLGSEMLMICDGEKPVAIGGIMGGLNSEIEDSTSRVLIESAYFNPVSIRRTSRNLELNTEASHRFERGIDPDGTLRAVNRAAKLMHEIGGGRLIAGVIDEHPKPQPVKSLKLSVKNTNRLLGTNLDGKEIEGFLKSIEFEVETKATQKGQDILVVRPPSFRVDIFRPEDLMEEVARLSGYNNIPTTFPAMPSSGRIFPKEIDIRDRIKILMTGFGFTEAITYSFVHRRSCDRLRIKSDDPRRKLVDILNPLTEDQAVMRTSLLSGLLETVHFNIDQQAKNLKLFEIGKIYINSDPPNLPRELEVLTGLWTGARHDVTWHGQEISGDFYDIKGVAEALLNAFKVDKVQFTRLPEDECTYTKAGYTAQILVDGKRLGLVGEIHPKVLANFDLQQATFIFELELDQLIPLISDITYSKPIPKFPAILRDITIIVDKDIETRKILEAAENIKEELVESLSLLDVFEGNPIAPGKKSISIRVTYRSSQKTLEDEDVNRIHKSIADALVKTFDATLPA